MENKKSVSVTLPQESYSKLSKYAKIRGMSVRAMHNMLITEAVNRNLFDDMILTAARIRTTEKHSVSDEIYQAIVDDFDHEVQYKSEPPKSDTGTTGIIGGLSEEELIEYSTNTDLDIEDLLS